MVGLPPLGVRATRAADNAARHAAQRQPLASVPMMPVAIARLPSGLDQRGDEALLAGARCHFLFEGALDLALRALRTDNVPS